MGSCVDCGANNWEFVEMNANYVIYMCVTCGAYKSKNKRTGNIVNGFMQ